MEFNGLPILIYGTAGASKETYYCIKQINQVSSVIVFNVLGFVELEDNQIGQVIFDNQKIVASDNSFAEYIKKYEKIGIVIPIGNPVIKRHIFEKIKMFPNVVFPNIIHPSVIYEEVTIQLGQGNIISAGNVLACDLILKCFNLINRGCTTGHDVQIGNFNTINPMVTISGNVNIGDCCLIGAGSTILQDLRIDNNVTVGAGAVLTRNAESGETLVGVPARSIKKMCK